MGTRTDHSADVAALRTDAQSFIRGSVTGLAYEVAADLLELHDATGLSLDDWASARTLVEKLIGHRITPNVV